MKENLVINPEITDNNEEKLENYSIMNIPSSFIWMDIGKKSVELFKD